MNLRQYQLMSALMLVTLGTVFSQTASFNFDHDAVDKQPPGFTSYATRRRSSREMACQRSRRRAKCQHEWELSWGFNGAAIN